MEISIPGSPSQPPAPSRRSPNGPLIVIAVLLLAGVYLLQRSRIGTWLDPSTGLMWTNKDNGSNKDRYAAISYCLNLRVGGFGDWRLPDWEEMRGIWDFEQNQVKGGLRLSGDGVWTEGVMLDEKDHLEAFDTAEPVYNNVRVLCVRREYPPEPKPPPEPPPRMMAAVPCYDDKIESIDPSAGTIAVAGNSFRVNSSDVAAIASWTTGDAVSLCLNGDEVTMSANTTKVVATMMLEGDQTK